ncbi:MAG: hypothetical protein N3D11_13475 [Candidatus Sumerlaeia bacterium]|nr:hypothetical protein [Candidatus Sumerlaeia bacterium]
MRTHHRKLVIGALSMVLAFCWAVAPTAYAAEKKGKPARAEKKEKKEKAEAAVKKEKAEAAAKKEKEPPAKKVALGDLPAPARTTIEALLMGGVIRSLDKEEADGKVIYDLEATIGDLEVEYDVLENGVVISAGMAVPYDSVPKAVRAAAEKYFKTAKGLKAFREGEEGQVFFEIEGPAATLKLTDKGQIVEEEKPGDEAVKEKDVEKKPAKGKGEKEESERGEKKVEKKKARGQEKEGNGNGNGGRENAERRQGKEDREERGEGKIKSSRSADADDDENKGDDSDDDEDEDDDSNEDEDEDDK